VTINRYQIDTTVYSTLSCMRNYGCVHLCVHVYVGMCVLYVYVLLCLWVCVGVWCVCVWVGGISVYIL